MKRAVGIGILMAEAAIVAYVVFLSYLLTSWMETDGFAAHATDLDWWTAGGKRFLIVGVIALTTASLVKKGNEYSFQLLNFSNGRMAVNSAVAVFVFIVAAGAIGAIGFVIKRPFM